MSRSIRDLWLEYEAHLKTHNPEKLKELNPPVTASQITVAEKAMGLKLPYEYVQLLKIHNGSKHWTVSFGPWDFDSLEQVTSTWKSNTDLLDDGDFDDDHKRVEPDPGVKKEWWSNKWVPVFSNGGGDSACIDLDPASGGTKGQVIDFDHAAEGRSIYAPTFREFFEDIVTKAIESDKKQAEKEKNKKSDKPGKPGWLGWLKK